MTAEFIAARPVDRFLKQIETRERTPRARKPYVLYALGAVASVLLVFAGTKLMQPDPGVNMKGGLAHITMKRGDNITSLTNDSKLAPGDALRFSVIAKTEGYAVVLERDSTGKITVVAPFGAKEPKAVNAGTNVLPDSAVLDEVRGTETFITIFSERPFDVQQAVEKLGCEGCSVEVSTFDKP